ncbi:MAG TPA: 7-carboxy-7-deazaguanine synthase [Pyrinomonadaceae bacterium]|nr:7-carboxy-7-deazaguanine synthase [Pyrinomonadaceae bacterium]
MNYAVKEIYYTLQGEGANVGRAAVFCRFAGCNLWSGHEKDRATATCSFCDTDFVGTDGTGGGYFSTCEDLARAVATLWPDSSHRGETQRLVVCTGGEPLLQLDESLIEAFHHKGFEIAVETNGTRLPPNGIDWICVSPKVGAELILIAGNELKLVFPQRDSDPRDFESLSFDHFFLQPMDGPERGANTVLAIQYCLQNPKWRLSLQTHKLLGIP